MKVISSLTEFLDYRASLQGQVALVPTMGNLHAGHLSLVIKATEIAEIVIATIFVNPMQFGVNEDLDNYPRTLEADLNALEELGVSVVFTPDMSEIYPEGIDKHTKVIVPDLPNHHCGANRPGHFTGVATIVCKLFNICRPDVAVFGQKDYQQLAIIRKMVNDLAIQTEVVGMPTVRNESGLALSSRNNYLTSAEQQQASALHKMLSELRGKLLNGATDFHNLESDAITNLNDAGFEMEFINIADQVNLLPATTDTRELVILAAGKMAGTRLIDNLEVNLTSSS